MINKWHIIEPIGQRKGCVIALPGRSVPAGFMEKFCEHMDLPNSLMVILEPRNLQWYPAPNGKYDQLEAVEGQKLAVIEINKRINKVRNGFNLNYDKIAIIGFSAGAVMALQILMTSRQAFAAVASFAGAILEPNLVPESLNKTPVLLHHATNDECFDWNERYLPMKDALIEKNYNLYCSEKEWGGHSVSVTDAEIVGKFIGEYLGY